VSVPGAVVLELRGLTAGYGGVAAVRDLDLALAPGEVVALLGPNGAGKTTTLLAACGLVPALAGSAHFAGQPLNRRVEQNARAGLVLVPDNRGVFHSLSVQDNLRLAAKGGAVDTVLDLFPELRRLLGQRCGLLSGGEQQMLALAKAMLAGPRVLLIDEMSLGLAPLAVRRLLPTIRGLADRLGVGVVLVEQHIDLALSIADRALVRHHGRVALTGPAAELRANPRVVERAYFGLGAQPRLPESAVPAVAGVSACCGSIAL
jgi:branched-chain amino acid transport system ATP-binding protein